MQYHRRIVAISLFAALLGYGMLVVAEPVSNGARVEACEPGDVGRACRAELDFAAAYLWSQQAREAGPDSPSSDELWRRSAQQYEVILRDYPGHAETLNNLALVYRSLGDTKQLKQLLLQLDPNADPAQYSQVGLILADTYAERGRWSEAFHNYRKVLDVTPDSSLALSGLVRSYRHDPTIRRAEILHDLLASPGGLTASGLDSADRALMATRVVAGERLWEAALMRLLIRTSRQRALTLESINTLAEEFPDEATRQLATLVADPGLGTGKSPLSLINSTDVVIANGEAGWWTENMQRRQALAQVAWSLGQDAVVKENTTLAEYRWTAGLFLSPGFRAYRRALEGKQAIYLDLITDLASLYHRRPELDQASKKSERLIKLLFAGKGQAYRVKDYASIQRHHTVLGYIFYDQGRWRESQGSWYADNAKFQLENAVIAAQKRQRSEGISLPLPYVKHLLAQGYQEHSRDRKRAAKWFTDAAEAYLETDGLAQAGEMLERGSALAGASSGVAAKTKTKLESLAQVYAARQQTSRALRTQDDWDLLVASHAPEPQWADGSSLPGLRADFVTQQAAKLEADRQAIGEVVASFSDVDVIAMLSSRSVPVRFAANSNQPSAQDIAKLQLLSKSLIVHPQLHLKIIGHTDDRGNAAANQALSETRAQRVAEILIGRGVSPGKLTAKGKGESEPISDNSTAKGRALNRRVELSVQRN